MYYKVENKDSKIYKQLYELRTKELAIDKENQKLITEKTGLKWKTFLGHSGQQNFRRTTEYLGFKFTEPAKVDLKTWQIDKEHKDIYVPNRRTKVGREMSQFLFNGLGGSRYSKVFEILKLEQPTRFTFPFVEIKGDVIIIFLGDGQEPKSKDVIEITKREFEQL